MLGFLASYKCFFSLLWDNAQRKKLHGFFLPALSNKRVIGFKKSPVAVSILVCISFNLSIILKCG
jgi:hypothetical protein